MNARTDTRPTAGDTLTDLGALLAGPAIVTMVLFPFALPAIVLAGVVLVPVLALALLAAVVAAVIAVPLVAMRGLRRRREARRERVAADGAGARVSAPAAAR